MKLQELTEIVDSSNVDLVHAVRQHAIKHYNEDGWDYVVETMDDNDIAEEIEGASTPEEAISIMHDLVKALDDRRKEIQATAF